MNMAPLPSRYFYPSGQEAALLLFHRRKGQDRAIGFD